MRVNVWTITGGKDRKRVENLVKSLPVLCHAVNYGEGELEIERLIEYKPVELPCGIAHDTLFTANFNRILRKELTGDADAVLILNDDIEFEEGAYDKLLEEAAAYPDPWITFNPVQVSMSQPKRAIMAGTGPAYPAGFHNQCSRDQLPEGVARFRWLPFCAVLVNLEAVRSVGLLDPTLRMWFSDSDYCTRGRYFGFDVVLAYGSVIRHINHATAQAEAMADIFRADQAAFVRKWNGDPLKDISG